MVIPSNLRPTRPIEHLTMTHVTSTVKLRQPIWPIDPFPALLAKGLDWRRASVIKKAADSFVIY